MKKSIVFVAVLLLAAIQLSAQTPVNMGSASSVTGCSFVVYDNGGPSNNYGTSRDDVLTIVSNNTSNPSVMVTVVMSGFDIHPTDTLLFYDGADITAPLLGWVNNSNTTPEGTYRFRATIYNNTRSLTVRFKSDGDTVGTGFALNVECDKLCQRVEPTIDFASMIPTPHLDEDLNDGYYYIDICPYDSVVHFAINGYYQDNDYAYHQDDNTSIFHWNFGNGEQTGPGLGVIDNAYPSGRGYDVALTMEDSMGCLASTAIVFRVRTSQNPLTSVTPLPDVCSGETVPLAVGYDESSTILVHPITAQQSSTLAVPDTIFLPDGDNCPPYGTSYRSPVTFTNFLPNATISSPDDILFVKLNIEHSFLGDIKIQLTCPNNRTAIILEDYQTYHYSGSTSAHFGLCYEPDGGGCNAASNPQGDGWNYIWSNNTSLGYTYAGGTNGYVYESANIHSQSNPHYNGNSTVSVVDSSNQANMTQIYHPYQSFSNLVGCPLNGTWYIEVTDTWGSDNGYVFGWEMALQSNLMPTDWTYDIDIVGINWSGGTIAPTSDSTAAIMTNMPGDYTYTFTIVDEFGCEYSDDMPLTVVQTPVPNIGDDVNICIGETATLSSGFNYIGPNGQIHYNWTELGDSTTLSTNESINLTDSINLVLQITTTNADQSLNCVASDTASVHLNPQPVANFSGDPVLNCAPLIVTLTDHTTFNDGEPHPEVTFTYQWSIINAANEVVYSSTEATPTFTIQEAGLYSVELIVTTDAGCSDTLVLTDYLTVNAQPISDFISTPERTNLGEGGTITFFNITDTTVFNPNDAITWTWDYGDGSDQTHDFNGLHQYGSWGEFLVTLSVETEQGCSSTITHTVYIEQDLVFPNVMTPNGDGRNDVFAIKNMNPLLRNTLSIYNRWGKKVYEKENYQTYIKDDILYNAEQGFDASSLSDGVYYYTFHYEGYTKAVEYHGSLTVIRGSGEGQ